MSAESGSDILSQGISFFCPIRHRGAGALPAASGDAASTAAGGEATEPRHHACAQRSQPHPGDNDTSCQQPSRVQAAQQ